MMIFKKAIKRRTFLRGAGASLALPFLDAMIPALASTGSAVKQPLRIGYLYLPTGRWMPDWIPASAGVSYEMPPLLQPLAPYRDQFMVLSGLDVKAGQGSHSGPCASFMTGKRPSRTDPSVGISVDQVIARQIGVDTQLASMELGVDPPELAFGAVDGLAGYYTSTISWRGPTTPLPRAVNPRRVFERLFGDTDTLDPVAMRGRMANRKSVLDELSGRVKQLMASVNTGDRHKLQEYLDSVRDVERGIEVAESNLESVGFDSLASMGIERPTGVPELYADHVKLMFDLMVLAYQIDMTRVITFMLGHEGSNRNYLELGAKDGHHSLTHNKGNRDAIELVKKIEIHQSELMAYFIGKMQSVREGDNTLLDNSIIVAGSAHSDANLHTHTNVPILVFGKAQNKIRGGQHIQYKGDAVSDLHMAVMDIANVSPDEYLAGESDASGILKGVRVT
jgi:hypothetical protein